MGRFGRVLTAMVTPFDGDGRLDLDAARALARWLDGRVERVAVDPFDPLGENHLEYFRYLRGESSRPATTLVDSRPFVALNDLAYVSSQRIAPIPESLVTAVREQLGLRLVSTRAAVDVYVVEAATRPLPD